MRSIAAPPALAALALMALAGCRLVPAADNSPPPLPPAEKCGADVVAEQFLNSVPTAEAKAYIAARVGQRPIRYYTIGDPITMDFNPNRLNVVLGTDGRIAKLRCG
jgi:Peptidase inhibitor I78 family